MLKDLNLKHLYYFWVIAESGSIARASDQLDLAPQTLSSQLSAFEARTGALFFRKGRGLRLTPLGDQVRHYASQIFTLAGELDQVLKQPDITQPLDLAVGFAASVHKMIAYHLITPAIADPQPIRLKIVSGRFPNLLKDLKRQTLDIVISDQPLSDDIQDLHSTHLLSSPLSLFAAPELARKLQHNFPASLQQQPLLTNDTETGWFSELTQWLSGHNVSMNVSAEISDSALIKIFAREGMGIFAAPTVIKDEVCRQYLVEEAGEIQSVFVEHFAITRTPDPIHPAIRTILQNAPANKSSKKSDN
ncbi:LysR family transcriptional regulator [Oceanospirillum sediminis]|uniref:LysR family transcriptional regulator n=1 Tax=Oceanospirillum sediminis TaxID=2760088 RepID=A0A839IJ74_9GAMM|nr:LysR family transcriptional regulator [Oceanospirillum sediminis]MBB1485225.1 LysR family transcriptional regulator [Oceanospirillum sediminis]